MAGDALRQHRRHDGVEVAVGRGPRLGHQHRLGAVGIDAATHDARPELDVLVDDACLGRTQQRVRGVERRQPQELVAEVDAARVRVQEQVVAERGREATRTREYGDRLIVLVRAAHLGRQRPLSRAMPQSPNVSVSTRSSSWAAASSS